MHNGALSTLDACIQATNLAKDTGGIPQARIALASTSVLLNMIMVHFPYLVTQTAQDTMSNNQDYIEFWLR